MRQQNQIKRTLSLPDSIEIVRSLLANNAHKNCAALANAVCQCFNFHEARGRPQIKAAGGACTRDHQARR